MLLKTTKYLFHVKEGYATAFVCTRLNKMRELPQCSHCNTETSLPPRRHHLIRSQRPKQQMKQVIAHAENKTVQDNLLWISFPDGER